MIRGTVLSILVASCGGKAELADRSTAVVEAVRPGVHATAGGDRSALLGRIRLGPGDVVHTDATGRAAVTLDGGAVLLLSGDGEISLETDDAKLAKGRAWVDVEEGESLRLATEAGTITARGAGLGVEVQGARTTVYVAQGEALYQAGAKRGLVRTGQSLVLSRGEPRVTSEVLWDDWTGGLAVPGPREESAAGVGEIFTRLPGQEGQARWPLVIRNLDVRVAIRGDLAITEVDQTFFNPASDTAEGLYRVRTPSGALLQRFAVDRDGQLVESVVKEQALARRQYQEQVYAGSTEDPALLEWEAPDLYRARIYPIQPGASRRIVIRYAEWIGSASPVRTYRYPVGRAPRMQEASIEVDLSAAGHERVRAGSGAIVVGDHVVLSRSDWQPRADFWLEIVGKRPSPEVRAFRAAHVAPASLEKQPDADEADYLFAQIRPEVDAPEAPEALDVVLLVDLSAGTDATRLEVSRQFVESVLGHLEDRDRVAVVAADLGMHGIGKLPAKLQRATDEHEEAILEALAREPAGGATDLGTALGDAAALLDPERAGAVVYVGDAIPTVGELDLPTLLSHLGRLPRPPRLYGVAVGSEARLDLLEGLVRGGGLAMRVEGRKDAAEAALRLLSHLSRPVVTDVVVDLGAGVDRVYPRTASTVVLGEPLDVVGRVREEVPKEIVIRGKSGGRAFERRVKLQAETIDDSGDLRLRWASERLRQILAEGGGREAIAEVGTRYGLLTPFTSFYVPSKSDLDRDPELRQLIDLRREEELRRHQSQSMAPPFPRGAAFAYGCSAERAPTGAEAHAEEEAAEWVNQASRDEGGKGARHKGVEGQMGRAEGRETGNQYGIRGPQDALMPGAPAAAAPAAPAEDPHMARSEAVDDATLGVLGALGYPGKSAAFGPSGGEQGAGDVGIADPNTIGRGGGGASGSGYGRGAGGLRGRSQRVPSIRPGVAQVRGSLSAEVIRRVVRSHMNEVKFCYEQQLAANPDLAGRVTVQFVISPSGTVQSSALGASTLGNPTAEQCIVRSVRRWAFPAPEGGGIVVVTFPFMLSASMGEEFVPPPPPPPDEELLSDSGEEEGDDTAHQRTRCSAASRQTLGSRRVLWRERLAQNPGAGGALDVFRAARRACELPGWRDRRAILSGMLDSVAGAAERVALYRSFVDDPGIRAFLRREILSRVRSAEDLRIVHEGLGESGNVDWTAVEGLLGKAPDLRAKVGVARDLLRRWPDDTRLSVRLFSLFEEAGALGEARRLAEGIRKDEYTDARARTLVGEFFLRQGDQAAAKRVWSEIVEFAPFDPYARRWLGDLYRAAGWWEEAYRQYETLAHLTPDDPGVSILLAAAAAGAGRVDEALRLEARVASASEPGSAEGHARIAMLWSAVRLAEMRMTARSADDDAKMAKLLARAHRGGTLREAGALRVVLTWAHPDAGIELWTSSPGTALARPEDLGGEYGIESWNLDRVEGATTIEVRQAADPGPRTVKATLLMVWNEGQEAERAEKIDLTFTRASRVRAFRVDGARASPTGATWSPE